MNLQVNRKKTKLADKLTEKAFQFEFVRNFVFNKAKQQVLKLTGGLYPAPLKVRIFFLINLKTFLTKIYPIYFSRFWTLFVLE